MQILKVFGFGLPFPPLPYSDRPSDWNSNTLIVLWNYFKFSSELKSKQITIKIVNTLQIVYVGMKILLF